MTDPANVAERGTLPGDEVFTCVPGAGGWQLGGALPSSTALPRLVIDPHHPRSPIFLPGRSAVDFGPGWFNPDQYFGVQKSLNAPGLSPAFNSEF